MYGLEQQVLHTDVTGMPLEWIDYPAGGAPLSRRTGGLYLRDWLGGDLDKRVVRHGVESSL